LQEIYHIQPTAFYTTAIVVNGFTEMTAVGDTVPLSAMYRLALAYHVCFSVYSEDSDDMANASNAQKFFDQFAKEMGA
jgi:hypothetical protein